MLPPLLPFDAHNHIHLGPSLPSVALWGGAEGGGKELQVGGMALMSTHPRDYPTVAALVDQLTQNTTTTTKIVVVPCFGVHPWFLAELTPQDWEPAITTTTEENDHHHHHPQWLMDLETQILAYPNAVVGEIGLDGVRYDAQTGVLLCPMSQQIQALEYQLRLAARHNRPVSLHAVQCWGPLLQLLQRLKREKQLPPRMYWHAFGGKVGTVDQLLALYLDRDSNNNNQKRVYFGFAPVVNFRSPKTAEVIQKIGLDRLVLETDHEDAALVMKSLQQGISFIAQALQVDEITVIRQTTQNFLALYGVEQEEASFSSS